MTYCHCDSCRRASGAPLAAYAAFHEAEVAVHGPDLPVAAPDPGVARSFCPGCGGQLLARYEYLPGQVYVALGLIDQAADLPPTMHAHAGNQLPWLHLADNSTRHEGPSRDALNAAATD